MYFDTIEANQQNKSQYLFTLKASQVYAETVQHLNHMELIL